MFVTPGLRTYGLVLADAKPPIPSGQAAGHVAGRFRLQTPIRRVRKKIQPYRTQVSWRIRYRIRSSWKRDSSGHAPKNLPAYADAGKRADKKDFAPDAGNDTT